MSLLPVAEALQALESDGLVESRPRVVTRVCLPTADEIRQRYEVREALESQASRLYSVKATVRVHHYPDETLAIFHGPRCLARYASDGQLLNQARRAA